jgi:hypothetical protein
MEIIEQMAEAALARDSLRLRSLVQDWMRSGLPVNGLSRPNTTAPDVLAVSAGLAELLALRQGQSPPAWSREIGAMAEPFYLVESAVSMKRLRALCEIQSPEPLRKRKLFAPPHFLEFA